MICHCIRSCFTPQISRDLEDQRIRCEWCHVRITGPVCTSSTVQKVAIVAVAVDLLTVAFAVRSFFKAVNADTLEDRNYNLTLVAGACAVVFASVEIVNWLNRAH